MQCHHCGARIEEDSISCPACGRPVSPSSPGEAGSSPSGGEADQGTFLSQDIAELRSRLQAALGEGCTVESVIGRGGFAVVFRVKDHSLNRNLAVKVISPDLIVSRTVVERFRREAETIAQLTHAHIVPVHFVGHQEDLLYLAMTFVDGESLADRLAREGSLPIHEAMRVLLEVASALDFAHRRGVTHRDIKPQNILIERDSGWTLLTDFGIARTAQEEHLTGTGVVLGTPAYCSPEQVTGKAVDHRSDLYSLGSMAFEMLTGRVPFTGPSPEAVLFKRVTEMAEPVESVNREIPAEIATIVNRCLAVDPLERPQSAAEIVELLGGPRSGGFAGQPLGSASRRRRRGWLAVAGFSGVALVAAITALVLTGNGTSSVETPGPLVPSGTVLIPGGTYLIGRDDGHPFSRPAHEVALDSFAIDTTEVTVASYLEFVDSTGMVAPWENVPDLGLPVTRVTWSEAGAFCAWRYPGGRLPTEEEWEAAARGPTGLRFPWGDTWRDSVANTASLDLGGPVGVGTFPEGRTALGVHDLVGNVWEWTTSRMVAYPGGGSAPENGSSYYVIRGGAYDAPDHRDQAIRMGLPPEAVADATRRGYLPATPQDRADFSRTGFRCVVSLVGVDGG